MSDTDGLFQEKITVLIEAIRSGKLLFREGQEESFLKIKKDKNGKIDPATVSQDVRLTADLLFTKKMEEEMRKIPLIEAQRKYVEVLEMYFSQPYKEMVKHKLSPVDIAQDLASTASAVKNFNNEAFKESIKEFWKYYGPIIEVHLEDLKSLKAVFGGDMFPSYTNNIVLKTGLYFDTTILPDPLLRTVSMIGTTFKPEMAFYYFVKHGLNVLQYKELLLANVNPPIVVVVPDIMYLMDAYKDYLLKISSVDMLSHFQEIFGQEFKTDAELDLFLKDKDSVEKMAQAIKNERKLLFDVREDGLTVEEKLENLIQAHKDYMNRELDVGQALKLAIQGRAMQTNDIILRSDKYGGTSLIDAPTSWQYFVWKHQKAQQQSKRPELKDLAVARALTNGLDNYVPVLQNIPAKALITLREEGALNEIRTTIRDSITTISGVSEQEFNQAFDSIVAKLQTTFEEHKKQVIQLESGKNKFYGFDAAPWLGKILIQLAASTVQTAFIATAAYDIYEASRELRQKEKEILNRENQLKRSPIGVLFHSQD